MKRNNVAGVANRFCRWQYRRRMNRIDRPISREKVQAFFVNDHNTTISSKTPPGLEMCPFARLYAAVLFALLVLSWTPETIDAALPCIETGGFVQFDGKEGESAIDVLPSDTGPLVGKLNLFVHAALDDWAPPANQAILGSNKAIIQLLAMSNGSFRFVLKLDGTSFKAKSAPHEFEPSSSHWIQIGFDTSTGEVTFSHSDANCDEADDVSDWTQLGDPVESGGKASIKPFSYFVLGRRKAGDDKYVLSSGKIYGIRLTNNDTTLTEGTFSSLSGAKNWALSGGLEIISPSDGSMPSAVPSPVPSASPTHRDQPSPSPSQKNNLIVILTDQQRYDTLQFVQEERDVPERARIRTTNLDRIAREGAYFRNAYTHCAVCGPARGSFMTGRTIENTGIRTNNMAKDEDLPGSDAEYKLPNLLTYDEMLVNEYGYAAEYYGKFHLPNSKGFVYANDVRRGAGALSWFGKYNEDGSKHLSWGMAEFYRIWLSRHSNATLASEQNEIGDQRNTFSTYFYDPDPLDTRYGIAEDYGRDGVKQPDQHGQNRLPDGLSITAHQAAETIEALERLAVGDKPFSLHLSLHSPHAPMIPTRKYYEMYNPDDMMMPDSLLDDLANSAYSNNQIPVGYDNATKVQRWTANYYGLITEVDEWIGKLLDKIDELGIAENTLLAFSTDHGEMLGSHGMREKNNFYEESSRVPLLLRMPGTIPAGTIVDDPVSHLDLHSTFLDYSVGRTDYETDGVSLRSYVEGGPNFSRDSFVVTMWNSTDITNDYRPSRDPAFMIRKDNWKLILSCLGSDHQLDMLFNLDEDPAELNNLIGLNGDTASDAVIGKAEHLKAMLVKYLMDADHPAAIAVQERRTWRELTFWVESSSIAFRDVLADGTRTEYLYLGTELGEAVSISIVGSNGHFSIRFDSQYSRNEAGFTVVAVRFAKIQQFLPQENSTLIVRIGTSEEKLVTLVPPENTIGLGDDAIADPSNDESFFDRLDFISLAPDNSPTGAPTSPPTSYPTSSSAPSSVPTMVPLCTDLPSELAPGDKLYSEQKPRLICSPNGLYRFGLKADGDLALWHRTEIIWSANTCCKGSGTYLNMQRDGNLVVYTSTEGDDSEDTYETSIYSSESYNNSNAFLMLDDDGRVTIRSGDDPNNILWENNNNLFTARKG